MHKHSRTFITQHYIFILVDHIEILLYPIKFKIGGFLFKKLVRDEEIDDISLDKLLRKLRPFAVYLYPFRADIFIHK